jgi:hypothetical protein
MRGGRPEFRRDREERRDYNEFPPRDLESRDLPPNDLPFRGRGGMRGSGREEPRAFRDQPARHFN